MSWCPHCGIPTMYLTPGEHDCPVIWRERQEAWAASMAAADSGNPLAQEEIDAYNMTASMVIEWAEFLDSLPTLEV